MWGSKLEALAVSNDIIHIFRWGSTQKKTCVFVIYIYIYIYLFFQVLSRHICWRRVERGCFLQPLEQLKSEVSRQNKTSRRWIRSTYAWYRSRESLGRRGRGNAGGVPLLWRVPRMWGTRSPRNWCFFVSITWRRTAKRISNDGRGLKGNWNEEERDVQR